jgi:DNA-binding GntR family transcriptional regulator
MQSLRDRITWVRGIAAKRAHRYALSFAEHRWILEALIERDAMESAARLREHLRRARDHTLSVLVENKD